VTTPDPSPLAHTEQTRELTVRALVSGLVIGAVLSVANVYVGLKTGFWDAGFVAASILGFAVFAGASRRYTPLENNITQTASSAVASIPSTAGLLGAIPGLALMNRATPAWVVACWGLALGVLGAALALPLRKKLVVEEKLPFPSGLAAAEVITAMHTRKGEGLGRARALLASMGGAMAVTWIRDGWHWIAQATQLPGRIAGSSLASLTFAVSWSPLFFGSGALVGPFISVSIFVGGIVSWGVLAPLLLRAGLAQPGYEGLVAWLTWPGVGLMLAATVVSLAEQVPAFARALRDLRSVWRGGKTGSAGTIALAGAAAVAVLAIGWIGFGMGPLAGLLGLLLLIPLMALTARSAGETDMAPLAQVGQITQVAAGPLTLSAPVANVGAGSIPAGAGATMSQLMWCFKTGHLLGASPRKQFAVTLAGVGVGALLVAPAYALIDRAYSVGSEAMPAPFASVWKAVALVVTQGGSALPPLAARAMGIAFLAGVALSLLARTRIKRFVPSTLAIGVGFIMPAYFALTMLAGALVLVVARRLWPRRADDYAAAIGGGAIAGESVMGVILAVLKVFGLLAAH
jgi:uncharacterized oligopeptide transporter (OPT) family protein